MPSARASCSPRRAIGVKARSAARADSSGAASVGRFSGVHQWPHPGVRRGWATGEVRILAVAGVNNLQNRAVRPVETV